MKKLFTLVVILFLSSSVYTFDFGMSFSARTAKTSELYDYQLLTEISTKHIEAEFEMERDDGQKYFNYITELHHDWRYMAIKSKRTYIEWLDINQIYIETVGRYMVSQKRWKFFIVKWISNGYWNAGLRQTWDNGIPNTDVIIGKSFKKEIKFFIAPAKFEYSINYFSPDFKKWENECNMKFNTSLLTYLDLYVKFVLRPDFIQFKTGLQVKI